MPDLTTPLFLLMTFLGACGSLLLKRGGRRLRLERSISGSFTLMVGCGLYFISALLNIYLLKVIPISVFLPLTAITYCWSLILARIYLAEKITFSKICGIAMIGVGIIGLTIK